MSSCCRLYPSDSRRQLLALLDGALTIAALLLSDRNALRRTRAGFEGYAALEAGAIVYLAWLLGDDEVTDHQRVDAGIDERVVCVAGGADDRFTAHVE